MNLRLEKVLNKSENFPIINEKMDEIVKIADQVVGIAKDGLQFSDIISCFEIIGPLMRLSDSVSKDWSDEKKDQFVVEVVYLIYQTIDTYPDGKQNNINIPFLFGKVEETFEQKVLEFATKAAIKALRSYISKS
jgi:hypothetical protein